MNRLNDQMNQVKRERDNFAEKNNKTDMKVRELENHLFMNTQEK